MTSPRRLMHTVASCLFILLTAVSVLGQQPVSCGCYCGTVLPPPCSDSACIRACGGDRDRDRDRGPDPPPPPSPTPTPDPREHLREEAKALNEQGMVAWNNRNWQLAAQYFQGAVEKDPDTNTYGVNLANARRQIALENERKAKAEADRIERRRRQAEDDRRFRSERDALSLKGVGENADDFKGLDPADSKPRPLSPITSARRRHLELLIARDMQAIRRLGFARRAEDFEAWERLSAKARDEFWAEVRSELTEIIVDKSRDKLLQGFKHFDERKGDRWIAFLESQENPPPPELIEAIRRVSRMRSKGKAAYDAKYIVDGIEKLNKARGAKDLKTGAPVLLDLVCDAVPQRPFNRPCKYFRTAAKLTLASLYNNATRRVARAEVERMTTLNERQLHHLNRLHKLMAKHVKELNSIPEEDAQQ